ncbi:TPA: type II toxin-antitoxin system RelE/ParE family toxin [Pseudomonas aeruginosa]|uniref:type II toxin-antitoxin system RelE/ParE family toxin n=1 Tax=Pseudomonas aeruginosa TaxID=287 RepID=UPI00068F8B1C|nr:type II toxin-antitoxin system RelE/ParE family toxin [Pseudomonas aeruginosa]EIU5539708.1 type II toxin-antitoxin system RelE/ParE family toxin [Pseudomonas aeruginosa]EKW4490542.1 type II toxin-antitoxin system RelE/ParE family toxin [Pseudomonas aeruginosa]EKY0078121.1 type II toxin-antitoxin system RelE/ParE family toxin [Pseudomonas aeruginosa]EKY1848025.1 type II toxin-antitoxin system RelE/ParE family toxin [Pseudomonas aeruginosa]ELN4432140.1 type II toxin-antitoxin system RelE/ParE
MAKKSADDTKRKEKGIHWVSQTKKEMGKVPQAKSSTFLTDLIMLSKSMSPFSNTKNLKGFDGGVVELIQNGSPAYRCVIYTKDPGKIWVLHVKAKSAQGTDRQLIETVKQRLTALKDELRKNRRK